MARAGWSIKEASRVLGVHPNKAPQAMRPAFLKVARLMLADPLATQIELLGAMREIMEAMEPAELDLRARMKQGLADLSEIRASLPPPS